MTSITIAGQTIAADKKAQIRLPAIRLYTDTDISIPIQVITGKKNGPVVFVSAAVHGDELNGIEIIRRLNQHPSLKISAGALILVPMVNVYGVLNQSRYMPDRRDLNRCFPGSEKGPLAGRVANIFLNEIVNKSDYGIDLHTGAIHRTNLPQIRADLDDPETRELAEQFGVPVLINSTTRDGSLRQSAVEAGKKILLYEAGEALRFDELAIAAGVNGVINILKHLGMTTMRRGKKKITPFVAYNSGWFRANASGIVRSLKNLGDAVEADDVLAEIGGPLGEVLSLVKATRRGIVIGKQNIPLVQEGDALYHIAYFGKEGDEVAEHIELMQDLYAPEIF